MIKCLLAAITAALFLSTPANAWLAQTNRTCPGGLGDLGTSYTFYWGVRAYNFAYAFAGSSAFNIIRSSDSVTCDFNYDGSGQLFNMTTASCSDSGTSNGQSPSTFCNATTCKVVTIYNQTGASRSFTQATDASRFTLDFTCGKNPFCVKMAASQSMATSSYTPPSTIQTLNVVGQRISGVAQIIFFTNSSSNPNNISTTSSGASNWTLNINGGATNNSGAVEGSFHAAVGRIDGTNSAFTVDSTNVTVNRAGSANAGTMTMTGANTAYWLETSYLASTGQDLTTRQAVISNQRACLAF